MSRWDVPPAYAGATAQTSRAGSKPADVKDERARELYVRWAELTGWRGFARSNGQRRGVHAGGPAARGPAGSKFRVRIIGRAPSREALVALGAQGWLEVPHLYTQALPGAVPSWSPYFTATLEFADLARLDGCVGLRWELAMPLHRAESVAQSTTIGRYGPEREEAPLAARAMLTPSKAKREPLASGAVRKPTLAIIDFGCPFLNTRYARQGGGSRVVALWDQDELRADSAVPWWSKPRCISYGREMGSAAIDEITAQVSGAEPSLDESAVYRSLDYLVAYDDARRRIWGATHGGHVMDIAAGADDPLAALCGTPLLDAAADAEIVFVQLPSMTAADSSGGSLSAHLLDGVRYALDVCDARALLVINISYGTFAGPHDGTSLIEQALDDLLARRKRNLAIVLAAGNARLAQCHTRRTVRKDKSALLRFALTPGDTTDTFLELWYPRFDGAKGALATRVRTADRDWSPWVYPGHDAVLRDEATRDPLAQLQNERVVMHGDASLILLSMAPTAPAVDDPGPFNAPGLWEMEVRLSGDGPQPVTFDAWIERDDPDRSGGIEGLAQPSFIGLDKDDQRQTLSSIATGERTVVVGGYRWSDGRAAAYSSLTKDGTTRSVADDARPVLPLLLAPCEEDEGHPDLRAAAVRSGEAHRMNGTSVAAPVVARRLFNFLSSLPAGSRTVTATRLRQLAAESQGVIRLAGD